MFLRANSIFLKPNTSVVGVLQHRRNSTVPRLFCSSSSGSKMDKQQQQSKTPPGGAMSSSFGEGYGTRSEEEGFGGIYPDTQQLKKDHKDINENSPEYDKSQGSEVKEKEKGRNTHEDSACK